jgi:hypothetical protein
LSPALKVPHSSNLEVRMSNGIVRRRHLVELQVDAECEAVRGLKPDARTAAAHEALFEYAVYVAIASR